MGSFLADKCTIQFPERCEMQSKEINWDTIILKSVVSEPLFRVSSSKTCENCKDVTSFLGFTSVARSFGGPWTGWIGSAPVQMSGCSLGGALSWWCDELLLVVVVLRLSLFLMDGQLVCWPRRVTPLQITADREKGRASWHQVGLPVQSLPCRRFRRACMRAYVHVVRVCVYMCMYVCVRTCAYVHICMCICICIRMHVYTCVYLCVCIFVHRLWVSIAVLQCVWTVS